MAALSSAGAYLGLVVPATGQDAAEYPPAASRLPVPIMLAGFSTQLPCGGDGGGLRSGQVRYITRPKSRTMRVTRQLMLPPSTVT